MKGKGQHAARCPIATVRTVVGSLHRISHEEDGPVQSDEVIVSLSSVELDCKSSRVSADIWELSAIGDSGESAISRGLLSRL